MLAQNENLSEEASEIRRIFAADEEWLLTGAQDFALQRDEIEVFAQNGKIKLGCLTARGWKIWQVLSWEKSNETLIFKVARKLNDERAQIKFVPRVSVADLREDLNAARLQKAQELAMLARNEFSAHAKIEKVFLSAGKSRREKGTIARILLANPNGKIIAVSGSLLEKTDVENLLSSALLWLAQLEKRRKISELWLVAEEKSVEKLRRLVALLRGNWHKKLRIWKLKSETKENSLIQVLENVSPLNFSDLWLEKAKKIARPAAAETSETSQKILELAPEAIDIVRSKHGETLRFRGLAFARVRRVLAEEKVWFGVEGRKRQLLDENSLRNFEDLFDALQQNRLAAAADKRSFLYRSAPESWLESVLRRDVSRLDPNLILAPLYAQFRFANKQGALDLLALRTDGRLVVIELKTAPDREQVFQAVDYWRQVELHRRSGNVEKSGLFAEQKILDEPPLIYLVAPMLSFHHDFEFLAQTITPEIEIWRFDLNEDWRREIKVARRINLAILKS